MSSLRLPNANIADALGRMPSVSIERDEGEGKYVQIRGTEPRLSNMMVDGVIIPSPETGVRQIKLDTIASDLVDSVEINKTLQANIDADGIGGSVNLVTKTASDTPTIALYGVGGYTPIIGGREVDQVGGTVGKRFLADKSWACSWAAPTTTTGVASTISSRCRPPERHLLTTTAWISATTSTTAAAGAPPEHGLQVRRGLQHLSAHTLLQFPQLGQQVGVYDERWGNRSTARTGAVPTWRSAAELKASTLRFQHDPLERVCLALTLAERQRRSQLSMDGRPKRAVHERPRG